MPYPKDNAKMTGDTHLPDVESNMFEEGVADAVGMDETVRERGEAAERGEQQKRPASKVGKAATVKGRKAKTSGAGSDRG
jgi:hypothetical protein